MHKRLMAVLGWLLAINSVAAQSDATARIPANEFRLKISPLALLELDGGLGIAGEYIPANSKLAYQLQVQPIFFSIDNAKGENGFETPVNTIASGMPTGIKLRPEIRYYFIAKPKGLSASLVQIMKDIMPFRKYMAPLQTYAAIDFLYKHTQRQRQGNLNISNGGVGAGYNQMAIYTDVKKVVGFDVKVGALSAIGKTGHWLIEAYVGIGYRQKKYSYKKLPTGAAEPERNNPFVSSSASTEQNTSPLQTNGVSIPAGLQLVYRL